MAKFINADEAFCNFILAVQRENKTRYIEQLEALEQAFATRGSLPAPLPTDNPTILFTALRLLLWRLAKTATADLPPQTRLNEMCEILREGGYLEVQYELVVKKNPP
jgi:hypothetical protein